MSIIEIIQGHNFLHQLPIELYNFKKIAIKIHGIKYNSDIDDDDNLNYEIRIHQILMKLLNE